MAYAAVTSLRHTINRFLKSGHDIQIIQNSSPEMIKLLDEEAASLANVLERLDSNSRRFSSKRLNTVDAQIRDVVFKLEDVVEFHLQHQFVSQSQNYIHHQHPFMLFSIDIEEVKQEIDSLIETVNKLKADYIYELSSSSSSKPTNQEQEEEEDDDDDDGVNIKNEPRMFGIESNRLLMKIKDMMHKKQLYRPFALCGMAGIGKTTLARKILEDPSVSGYYGSRAFVTVGPEYELEHVLLDILKQLDPSIIDDEEIIMLLQGDDQENLGGLERMLNEYLKDRRYLIVLDDVWDDEIINMQWFYHKNDGSCTFVTSRLGSIADPLPRWEIPLLDKKGSWDLLCANVFGEGSDSCTLELERAGKKIAENCEGLPLTIVTVANILSKHERTPEHWNEVAANKQHPVYKQAYAKMHKVLLPSYYNLPQYLRVSFLYMGVFPQNYEIPCSKLHRLWMAEGFIQCGRFIVDGDHFERLLNNSVIIVHSTSTADAIRITCKTVSLHSSFWYVCKKEAGKSKFFHSCTTIDDCLPQGIDTQRRLCIYNPVLFAIKDAFGKMASVSAARSLLCTGVYHQYPVPVCFGLTLLRVLDALTIHFYEFPMEVLKLIHLTYFALTCDGKLLPSISKLWNLKYLIVDRRMSIKSIDGAPSYLPVEIWDMKNLEHLQVKGSDLPEPPEGSRMMLLNLSILLDVSPHSCTESILRRVPNLTKLGIRIEWSPDDSVHQPLSCYDHIRGMRILRSFKCVVVNPRISFEVAAPSLLPLPVFPRFLVKLTLSGFGYHWEEMSKISSLPNLKVLKLLSYAFRGPKWDVQDKEFPLLKVLVIEETDLVQWTYQTPNLKSLSIKHCYKLKDMPMVLAKYLAKIELVDCNPLVVSNAKKVKEGWKRKYNRELVLNVHSSWDEQN